jgi:hypothetical protein
MIHTKPGPHYGLSRLDRGLEGPVWYVIKKNENVLGRIKVNGGVIVRGSPIFSRFVGTGVLPFLFDCKARMWRTYRVVPKNVLLETPRG